MRDLDFCKLGSCDCKKINFCFVFILVLSKILKNKINKCMYWCNNSEMLFNLLWLKNKVFWFSYFLDGLND